MKPKKSHDPELLLKKCLESYGMNIPEFSYHIGVPVTTVHTWKNGRGSAAIVSLLKALLRNRELEDDICRMEAYIEVLQKKTKQGVA